MWLSALALGMLVLVLPAWSAAAANAAGHHRSKHKAALRLSIVPEQHRLIVRVRTKTRATCRLTVSSHGRSARLPKRKATRRGRVTFAWGVPLNAPSGRWTFSVRCVRAGKTYHLKKRATILTGGDGTQALVEWSSLTPQTPGKGAGIPVVRVTVPDKRAAGDPGDDYPAELKNRAQDSVSDQWGEYNRECTSFVAWALATRNGFNMPFHDDATGWGPDARERGYTVNSTPAKGSVAWSPSGHVAYVQDVVGGQVHIEEYNHGYPRDPGRFSTRTVPAGNFQYIHFADVASGSGGTGGNPGPGTPGPGTFGALRTDGAFFAKEGIGGSWVHETDGVQQITIDGDYIGALLTNGTFVAKEGLTGTWVTETGGVKQIAIGGNFIGALHTDGSFYAKEGIGGSWVTETANIKQISVGR